MTTLAGKSAFPEKHPLALGSGSSVMNGCVYHFLGRADVVFGVGTSFTKHGMTTTIPSGKVFIHATNDPIDIDKDYYTDYPIIGDAKLVLQAVYSGLQRASNTLSIRPRPQQSSRRYCICSESVVEGVDCPSSHRMRFRSLPIALSGSS